MSKILVFGSSGFIGRAFGDFIHTSFPNNYRLYGVDRVSHEDSILGYQRTFSLDVFNRVQIKSLLQEIEPDYILYLIGTFTAESFGDYLQTNVVAGQNLLESCLELSHKIKKILFSGSAAEYGSTGQNPISENSKTQPVTYYGLSKLFQTQLAQFYFRTKGLPCCVARTFNVSGDGASTSLSIGSWRQQIEKIDRIGSIDVGNLNSQRDYLPVEKVADYYLRLLLLGAPGEIYNVCSGLPVSMRTVLEEMIITSKKEISINVDEARLRSNEISIVYGDNAKLLGLIK